MNRLYIFFISMVILLAVSCVEEELLDDQSESGIVLLNARIDAAGMESRIETGVDGKGRFVDGDRITLYVNGVQRELTMEGGKWMPELKWDGIYGETAVFKAFYRNVNNDNRTFKHTVLPRQDAGDNFEQSDLLYAGEVTVAKGSPVDLNFRHLMGCLTVVLKSNKFTEQQLCSATVKVQGYNAIDVNPDGTLGKLYDWRQKTEIAEIVLKHRGNGIYQAVMCPQTVHELDYGSGWLYIKVGDREVYIKEAPSELAGGMTFDGFESGMNITLNYTFNERRPDPVWGNKTFWVDGLKDMPEPDTEAWKVYHQDRFCKLKHLPWDIKYGWYDLNKLDRSSGSTTNDRNLCWAATASNMIHWWLDRNRENVDRYCTENGVAPSSIPQVFTDRHKSEVFDVFKKSFEDNGSYIKEGLRWYFYGQYDSMGNGAALRPVGTGGYFKDVFNDHSGMTEYKAIGTMEHLTAALKSAFEKKQAIGLEITFQTLPTGHAMTIWGARFDEYGEATHIYYVDNDDGEEGTPTPHNGLIETRVGSYEGNGAYSGRACMGNSQGKTTIPVNGLVMLNQKHEVWDSYFARSK